MLCSQAPAVGWSTPSEIAILTVSVLIFTVFLLWERFIASEPILPLNIFRAPTFLSMIFVVLFSYMAFGIALWYSISWQQILRQLSVLQIAINLIPFGLGSTAAVGLAVFLLPRVEAKLVMGIGVIVIIGASLLLATMPMHQTYWAQVFPAMLLCGCCPDFVYLAAQVIASNSVKRKHQGIASSLVGTLNLYGVSLGLGFAGTIEVEVGKKFLRLGGVQSMEATMSGFKAALYFSAALATIGLILDFAFVRLPKLERHGWEEENMSLEAPDVAVRNTSSEANTVAVG
jgi:MFS family permease